jgi:phage gp45-like
MRFSTRTVGDRMNNALKRVTIESNNDDPLFREHEVSLYTQEKQKEIEHFEPYGLTSRVKKPTGQKPNQKKAEAVMVFTGGNRSHGALLVVGDRRYRIKGLAEGEVALFDDQGHQVHITRDGIVVSAPKGKKIVTQIMSDDQAPKPTTGQGEAKTLGQGKQAGQQALASLTLDKDSWTVNHPTQIQFTVGQSTLTMTANTIALTAPTITSKVTARFETLGKTYLGLDNKNEPGPIVSTVGGPAKQTFAKVGS